ncbi:MAG: S-layer family protein [Richelia sp. RM2_1_2]|nr:S-layer family protein [Richelia sp. RM2_1_2]
MTTTKDINISGSDKDYGNRFQQIQETLRQAWIPVLIARGRTQQEAGQEASQIASRQTEFTFGSLGNNAPGGFSPSGFGSLSLSLNSTSRGAGNINLSSTNGSIILSNDAAIKNDINGGGEGGDIKINTQSLSLTGGSNITSNTYGKAESGSIIVNTSNNVEVIGRSADGSKPSSIVVNAFGSGNASELRINTGTLTVKDGAAVQSVAISGSGNAGTLTVNASEQVELVGSGNTSNTADEQRSGLFTQTQSAGNAGNLTINTPKLIVKDGAIAKTDATIGSSGKGADLIINASELVEVSGKLAIGKGSLLSAQTQSIGDGGDLILNTPKLVVKNSSDITTSTFAQGNAGDLIIRAKEIELKGTSIPANIEDEPDTIRIDTGLFAQANANATGNASNIDIHTEKLVIEGAIISVSNQGTGEAGNIQVSADSIRLDKQGGIGAINLSGNGGNIQLLARNLLLLRNNSRISSRAGTQDNTGSGGNIAINTDNLVAIENSDIDANAFGGLGGKVIIDAEGIFGTQARLEKTSQSDITASSDLGPQFNGIVQLNTPDVDPASAINSLPTDVVDPSNQIDQGCAAFNEDTASEFKVTGRGGLPPSPDQPLSSNAVWEDIRTTATNPQKLTANTTAKTPKQEANKITPASGWVFNEDGEVTLISSASKATSEKLEFTPKSCPNR